MIIDQVRYMVEGILRSNHRGQNIGNEVWCHLLLRCLPSLVYNSIMIEYIPCHYKEVCQVSHLFFSLSEVKIYILVHFLGLEDPSIVSGRGQNP